MDLRLRRGLGPLQDQTDQVSTPEGPNPFAPTAVGMAEDAAVCAVHQAGGQIQADLQCLPTQAQPVQGCQPPVGQGHVDGADILPGQRSGIRAFLEDPDPQAPLSKQRSESQAGYTPADDEHRWARRLPREGR